MFCFWLHFPRWQEDVLLAALWAARVSSTLPHVQGTGVTSHHFKHITRYYDGFTFVGCVFHSLTKTANNYFCLFFICWMLINFMGFSVCIWNAAFPNSQEFQCTWQGLPVGPAKLPATACPAQVGCQTGFSLGEKGPVPILRTHQQQTYSWHLLIWSPPCTNHMSWVAV